jgi:histidine triad (HIT) family protein
MHLNLTAGYDSGTLAIYLLFCVAALCLGVVIGEFLTPFKAILFPLRQKKFVRHRALALNRPSPFLETPASSYVAESERAFVIRDRRPRAPVHFLVIPKNRIVSILDAPADLLAEMLELAKATAVRHDIADSGFRLVINTNPQGLQTVYHLHIHLLGGRQLRVPFW